MGTYYVDSDVGLTGGSGTPADPYGIATAIAAAEPGDTFYWRGGGEGDVTPGATLDFHRGGSSAAPVRWIGTDAGWGPIPAGQAPGVGVDGAGGAYPIVQVSGAHQIFEGLRVHRAAQGRDGGIVGWSITAGRVLLRNCTANDCGTGFSAGGAGALCVQAAAHDVGIGFLLANVGTTCLGCLAFDTVGAGFRVTGTSAGLFGCRAYALGSHGIELYRDQLSPGTLLVDHCAVYQCVDGVNIHAYAGTYTNICLVSNNIFDTCSGYAVNVTPPAGQPGVLLHNASHACAAGQVPAGRPGMVSVGWLALPGPPFVDAARGDLRLVRGTPCIGAATDGGDLGAWQRRGVRLPYPLTV